MLMKPNNDNPLNIDQILDLFKRSVVGEDVVVTYLDNPVAKFSNEDDAVDYVVAISEVIRTRQYLTIPVYYTIEGDPEIKIEAPKKVSIPLGCKTVLVPYYVAEDAASGGTPRPKEWTNFVAPDLLRGWNVQFYDPYD